MSWVCEEFSLGPREALATLGYDPDDVPWNLLPRIAEIRRFAEFHREYTRIMETPAGKGAGADLDRLMARPYWDTYNDVLLLQQLGLVV